MLPVRVLQPRCSGCAGRERADKAGLAQVYSWAAMDQRKP